MEMKFKIGSQKIIDVPLITLVPIKVLALKHQFHKKIEKQVDIGNCSTLVNI